MILAFKPCFVEPIVNGKKIHTIREDKPNRWKIGNKIHMATGVRTKNYKQFYETTCKSVQQIEIIRTSEYVNDTIIKIDDKSLNTKEKQQLAWNDSFDNLISLAFFFEEGFKGKIIHWTNFKY